MSIHFYGDINGIFFSGNDIFEGSHDVRCRGQHDLDLGMRKPVIDKTGYQAAKSVVADTRRIIDLVIQYGQNNNTDFIPRESYNKISKAVSGASMANLKRATKKARDRKLSNFKKYYSQYASMLMSEHYSNHDRDFNWIKTCQRKMKRLREETGCDKSPWETWDGITYPTK